MFWKIDVFSFTKVKWPFPSFLRCSQNWYNFLKCLLLMKIDHQCYTFIQFYYLGFGELSQNISFCGHNVWQNELKVNNPGKTWDPSCDSPSLCQTEPPNSSFTEITTRHLRSPSWVCALIPTGLQKLCLLHGKAPYIPRLTPHYDTCLC